MPEKPETAAKQPNSDEPDGYLEDGTPVYEPPWPPDPRYVFSEGDESVPPEMCVRDLEMSPF